MNTKLLLLFIEPMIKGSASLMLLLSLTLSSFVYGAAYDTEVIGVALDMDAGTLTFYKNGVSQGQAFTGISGTIYAMASLVVSGTLVANFGASALAYTPPAGYNSGLYKESSAVKTINGLAKASVKTAKGLAIASVKTVDGLS